MKELQNHAAPCAVLQKRRRNGARLDLCGNVKTATYDAVRSVNAVIINTSS